MKSAAALPAPLAAALVFAVITQLDFLAEAGCCSPPAGFARRTTGGIAHRVALSGIPRRKLDISR